MDVNNSSTVIKPTSVMNNSKTQCNQELMSSYGLIGH